MEGLRKGKSNPEIAQGMGISRAGARSFLRSWASWASPADIRRRHGYPRGYPGGRPPHWHSSPGPSRTCGSGAKAAAAAAVVAFAVPEGFGVFVTDSEISPVPDFSNFSNVTASGRVRLTDNPARDAGGAWSPDCSRIVFTSNRDGSVGRHDDIYTMNANGTDIVNLTRSPRGDSQPAWSADAPASHR